MPLPDVLFLFPVPIHQPKCKSTPETKRLLIKDRYCSATSLPDYTGLYFRLIHVRNPAYAYSTFHPHRRVHSPL